MNPVNSEQHMHYIHLVITEQHCSGECLHMQEALSQSSHACALCVGAAIHSPPQVSITAHGECLHNHLMHVPMCTHCTSGGGRCNDTQSD